MSKFVLTAQLQLQAPTNVGQVVNKIQSQLNNVKVNVQAQGAAQATSQINKVTTATQQASNAATQLGKSFGLSIKRFAAFSIATRAVSLFTSSLSNAVKEAISFERELIKIAQVTGKSIGQLRDLTNEITRLSTSLGVSSSSILGVSRILSQAGLSAQETKIALDALAKSELAPTFDDITQTAEGAVAIFNQFRQGAAALEEQLGAINAVAGKFAVEAGDLISVIRRTGGVFQAAGGDLNELIALFTSVRATTRESAESIATGLRTIFTRIQRPKTIEFLRQYGVELLDLEGKFVGPFEATRRLSEALAGLEQGDISFIRIAEELGGFRQIGKVIPLLQQFATAQEALNVAQRGSGSLADDAATAQASLAIRITKVKEEFLALVRSISESTSFQLFANTALNLASALIKLADALKPVLPLLATLAGIRLATGLGGFLRGVSGGLKTPKGFATGGIVPGSGNRDTVPAMLTPGEFVIRKSSVAKIGAGNLAAMNENKYAAGGVVTTQRSLYGKPSLQAIRSQYPTLSENQARRVVNGTKTIDQYKRSGVIPKTQKEEQAQQKKRGIVGQITVLPNAIGGFFLKPNQGTDRDFSLSGKTAILNKEKYSLKGAINGFYTGKSDVAGGSIGKIVKQEAAKGLKDSILSAVSTIRSRKLVDVPPIDGNEKVFEKSMSNLFKQGGAQATIEGYMLEGIISALSGANLAGGKVFFDYPKAALNPTVKKRLGAIFRSEADIASLIKGDAKRTANPSSVKSIVKKLINDIKAGNTEGVSVQKFATGGAVGTDTVPALLTPGEFVVNRSSARRIGYGNLNRMNKVGKYASGGVVQHFANGSGATGVSESRTGLGLGGGLLLATSALQSLVPAIDENSSAMQRATSNLLTMATTFTAAIAAVEAFGVSLTASNLISFFGTGPNSAGGLLKTGFSKLSNSLGSNRFFQGIKFGAGKFASSGPMSGGLGYSAKAKQALQSGGVPGTIGRVIGKAGSLPGISTIVKSFSSVFGSLGKVITPFVGGLTAALGPILAIAGTLALINGVVAGFRDLDGKLQDAIKAEDTARAQQLAVSKAASESIPLIGSIVSALSDSFGGGSEWMVSIGALLGGPTVDSIKTSIAAQISSAKAQKALTKATEKSAEAMKEFEAGNISAAEALKAGAEAARAIYQSRLDTQAANKENTALKSQGGYAVARNIFTLGGLLGETSGARNRRIESENQQRTDEQTRLEKEFFQSQQPAINAFARQVAAGGGTLEQFKATLDQEFGEGFFDQNKGALEASFENIRKEAERTRKAFEAMNLGFQNVSAVAGALSVSLDNYMASQEAGYNALDNSIRTLEASITNAAQGISDEDFGSALGFASAGLRELGASNEQITKFTENLSAINTAQKFFAKASKDAKQSLIDEFERGVGGQQGAGVKREAFADAVVGTLDGVDEEVKKRIKDALANADISQDDLNAILGGNMEVLDRVLNDLGETTLKQVIGPLKELAKYNAQLADITKKRLELENNLIAAQRNLLEAQMEAAEIIAKYGGPAVTTEMRRQNILDQANLQGGNAGVGDLRVGSAAELNARNAEARARLAEIGQLRADAAKQGPAGDAARQRLSGEEGVRLAEEEKRLQELAKSDYETTKQLIKLKEEELKLIQEKNRLEKSSIEALITGDIAKFFEQQAAVGATAAIALGNDSLQNVFGPQALGQAALDIQRQQQAGATSLYGQQLGGAGGLVERGFGAAASARGIGASGALGMAQVAAGTTPEEEAAMAEIRSLASTLPNYAETQLQVAQQDKTTADIQYQAAQMQLQAAKETARARGVDVAGMAMGGVVYANRGIFVPRGTDTVPAMLTPGEFVVRREAVKRGNNLQILRSMNRGQSGVSNNGAVAMADGGVVYARRGGLFSRGTSQGSVGLSPEIVNNLSTSLTKFNTDLSANIDKLNNTNLNVKLDTTNVNVNLNGGTFLAKLKDDIRDELLVEISNSIREYSVGQDGRLKRNPGLTTT